MNYPVLVYCAGLWAAFREFHNNWSVMISLHPVGYPVTPHGHDDRRRICILTSRRNSSREYLGLTHFYSIMAHNLFLSSHIRLFIHYVTYAVKYYYYYYYTICMSPVTGLFFPVLLLNQRWSPPLTLQASHCSTFRIMCDVPSIAVFCSESIECFPGTVSKFFFKLLVTIPVAPIITGTIVHFRFHIRCISIHKLLYFNFFAASFCTTFLSVGIATSISVHVFYYY